MAPTTRNSKSVMVVGSSRWYIETDAFVAPSPGYPSEGYDFQVDPSPLTIFPGHECPAKLLPGKISLESHGISMPSQGALYEVPDIATWSNTDVVIIDCLTATRVPLPCCLKA